MKKLFYSVCVFAILGNVSCIKVHENAPKRDYDYENYCDSIWYVDRDYYNDVLVETDRYQEYMETVGCWWELYYINK